MGVRNVRNFYINANIDGRQSILSGGCRGKDGGQEITYTQRDEGTVKTAFTVSSYAEGENLITRIWGNDGALVYMYVTKR